jgi:hypothetical protein
MRTPPRAELIRPGGIGRTIAGVWAGETAAVRLIGSAGVEDQGLELVWDELGFFLGSQREDGVRVGDRIVPAGARGRLAHGTTVSWGDGSRALFQDVRDPDADELGFRVGSRTYMPRAVLEIEGDRPATIEIGAEELHLDRSGARVDSSAGAWATLYWHPVEDTVHLVLEHGDDLESRRALGRGERIESGGAALVVRRLAVPRTELRATRGGPLELVYVADPADPDA